MNFEDQLEHHLLTDDAVIKQIEDGLRATYFTGYEEGFLDTERGREDIQANVFKRYNSSLSHVVPWVARHIDLGAKEVVEVGSGNGASTAAFAHFVKSIQGYEIDKPAVDGAMRRFEIMGCRNARVELIEARELIPSLLNNHPDGYDIALLFAVIEHQTVQERIETIRTCWQQLRPGGLLVVAETPNILQYFDSHTSLLPFLHMLPTELYVQYVKNSPRNGFNTYFEKLEDQSKENLDLRISRWGRGVSYHDFEIALGPTYAQYIVANGFEKNMLDWAGITLEEEVLRFYVETKELPVPAAFTRDSLNLIFMKSDTCTPVQDANVPPPVHVSHARDLAETKNRLVHLEKQLEDRNRYLSDILESKRWRWANVITSPYRFLKELFKK